MLASKVHWATLTINVLDCLQDGEVQRSSFVELKARSVLLDTRGRRRIVVIKGKGTV